MIRDAAITGGRRTVGRQVTGLVSLSDGVQQAAASHLSSSAHICHIRRRFKHSHFSVLHAVAKA